MRRFLFSTFLKQKKPQDSSQRNAAVLNAILNKTTMIIQTVFLQQLLVITTCKVLMLHP